jgi:hypothetical protein
MLYFIYCIDIKLIFKKYLFFFLFIKNIDFEKKNFFSFLNTILLKKVFFFLYRKKFL